MSQIQTHYVTNNTCLGIETGDTSAYLMNFKADKRPDHQPDMAVLRGIKPALTPFKTRDLFKATMLNFNLPCIQSIIGGFLQGHVQTAGGPIFLIAVFCDCPKYFDPAIPLEMVHGSLSLDEDYANHPVTAAVETDIPVLLEFGEPVPV